MKYGVICAMPEEINLIKQDIAAEHIQTIAGREFHTGQLYGRDTVLVMSHIGKVAAALTASLLIDHFHVNRIIFSGTAGGLDPALNVGDTVIADYSVQHDFDVPGGDPFRIPMLNKSYLASDPQLSALALDAVTDYIQNRMKQDIPAQHLEAFHIESPKAVVGTIASGDQFICDSGKNRGLFEQIRNAKCVEMEGAAVAQVCYEFQVPFTIIRVISDCANDASSVDFEQFVAEAACHFTRGSIQALFQKLSQ